MLQVYFLFLICFLSKITLNSTQGQDPLIHYPCNAQGFYLARRTIYDNWWVARLYLNDYLFTSQVRLIVKIDETGTVELDPRSGEVKGPNFGHTFHLHYYGTPANLTYVEFKVKGHIEDIFPNLNSLEVNHHEICHSPKQWVNNNAEKTTTFSTSLLGGFLTTPRPNKINFNYDKTTTVEPEFLNKIEAHSSNRPQQRPHSSGAFIYEGPTEKPKRTTTTTQRPRPILAAFVNPSNAPATVVSTYRPPVVHQSVMSQNNGECGRKKVNVQAFITNGYKSKPGDWPWHAAVYHKNHRSSTYKCGGTLLNHKTVLTAAHCCFSYGNLLVPQRMSVQVGRYDLNKYDTYSAEYNILNIVIHDKYSTVDFSNDIAVLQLSEQVQFNNYIQPICLWKTGKEDLKYVVKQIGTVVGWGLNEKNQKGTILSEATMPVVDFHTCLESDRDFFGLFLSEYNFCAGFINGTSVCQGDSGGGMFFAEDNTWYLRGLVSHGTVIEGTNLCNPRAFVIFTDVAKYTSWIRTLM